MTSQDTFLQLVRLGIGHDSGNIAGVFDWNDIQSLAERQGLSAIIVDGVEKLPETQRPPKVVLLQWIGKTLQSYEYRYELYRRAIAELASFYNENGYKMMILKGYACSLGWPKPEHRPCGDIDIWLFGRQKEADAALVASFKIQDPSFNIDNGHHHHTMFYWRDFMVENHYDFVNVYAHKSSREIEKVFKQLGEDDTHYVELYGEKVYLPSPNLHALFLIRHMVIHFVGNDINLRQLIDWAFFVKNHTKEIDWQWLEGFLERYHMKDFFNCINAICVENLGFDVSIFPIVQFRPNLKDKVLKDVLYPKFSASEPSSLIPRLLYKYRRWQGNAWKQELCYSESRWSVFWSGVWAHLLKPASI